MALIRCKTCKGARLQPCEHCGGRGETVCYRCNGRGWLRNPRDVCSCRHGLDDCQYCTKMGRRGLSARPCEDCNGTGWQP